LTNARRHGERAQATDPDFALVQPGKRARSWLFGLVVALPLVLIGASHLLDDGEAGAGPFFAVAGICVLAWAGLDRLMRRHRLKLGDGMLEVATSLYTRRLPLSELDLERARVVDLGERPEYRPMLRTNGMSLPGFHSGWYRLRSGGKALVATAGGKRLLWVPTHAGHDLVLQPADPRALLERLRAMAAGAASR